jgi:hypothetical protein
LVERPEKGFTVQPPITWESGNISMWLISLANAVLGKDAAMDVDIFAQGLDRLVFFSSFSQYDRALTYLEFICDVPSE